MVRSRRPLEPGLAPLAPPVLVAAGLVVVVAGLESGRTLVSIVGVGIGLIAGLTLGSPIGSAAVTIAVMLIATIIGGTLELAAGSAIVAAAGACVTRRPAVSRAVRRVTAGNPRIPIARIAVLAFVVAPLTAAVIAAVVPPPGELLGLGGTSRHVVTGVSLVSLALFTAAAVALRARAVGARLLQAALWGAASVPMIAVWGLGAFLVGYLLHPFPGG